MNTDLDRLARNICRLIPADADSTGLRWMVYQMADEIKLCHDLLCGHEIALPRPADRPSSAHIVDSLGNLTFAEGDCVQTVAEYQKSRTRGS